MMWSRAGAALVRGRLSVCCPGWRFALSGLRVGGFCRRLLAGDWV